MATEQNVFVQNLSRFIASAHTVFHIFFEIGHSSSFQVHLSIHIFCDCVLPEQMFRPIKFAFIGNVWEMFSYLWKESLHVQWNEMYIYSRTDWKILCNFAILFVELESCLLWNNEWVFFLLKIEENKLSFCPELWMNQLYGIVGGFQCAIHNAF